ncbi:MAG: hypothetical protein M3Z85_02465 [Acidobacteriota bacterium]|nr:hypothetical protein [Acidobacteriota bacterium]
MSWTSADGNFSVLFKGKTPFKEFCYGAAKRQVTATAQVKSSAPFQGFKSSAMVIKNGTTWKNDPEIVIDDGGDPGQPPAGKKKSPAKNKKSGPKKEAAKKKSR